MSSNENVVKELQRKNIGEQKNLNVKLGIILYVSNENILCKTKLKG